MFVQIISSTAVIPMAVLLKEEDVRNFDTLPYKCKLETVDKKDKKVLNVASCNVSFLCFSLQKSEILAD